MILKPIIFFQQKIFPLQFDTNPIKDDHRKFYIRIMINDNNFKTLNSSLSPENKHIWTDLSDVLEVDVDYRNIIEYEIY